MSSNPASKQTRWYFGGVASATAAMFTHPLDLLKVHLITQQEKKMGLIKMGYRVVQSDGLLALYNGISASILRQLTYSMTRFGIYESVKNYRNNHGVQPAFWEKTATAAVAGFGGGVVGNPADMVNVRMQNDMKLSAEKRRNYKNALDGLVKVVRGEGPLAVMNGVTMTSIRAAMMTVGQLAFYDIFKQGLLRTQYFVDNSITHVFAGTGAAAVATCLTQPADVMKTRLMNAKPGLYSGLVSCGIDIFKSGPQGFYKGFMPALMRIGPHTILMFVFLEQMKKRWGVLPATSKL